MSEYASGKHAFGFCDRCGFRYNLNQLRGEVVNQRPVHNRVCPTCWDEDQPQLLLGKFKIYDPQALHNPRPDQNLENTNSLFGWNPVGAPTGMYGKGEVGTVTVTTT